MYKRKKKPLKDNSKLEDILEKENLSLSDVTCAICLNILIDPVTMPCSHQLCLQCFRGNVSQTSLNCPLCRKRISIWVRKYPNYEHLVDQNLWSIIKEKFPKKVQARLEDRDDSQEFLPAVIPKISSPGEIRKEYEKELESVNAELEATRQKEDHASLKVITKIVKEEHILSEKSKQEMREISQQDFELAKVIRQKQVSEQISNICAQKSLLFSPIAKPNVKTLDRYLEKSPTTSSQSRAEVLNITSTPKGGSHEYIPIRRRSLNNENFASIGVADKSNGSMTSHCQLEKKDINFSGFDKEDSLLNTPSTPGLSLYLSTSNEGPSVTMLSMEGNDLNTRIPDLSSAEDEHCNMNISASALNESSMVGVSNEFSHLNLNTEELRGIIAQQRFYDERKVQADEDRRLAFQLEKELKFVNRRKGTDNEYSLRTTPKSASKAHAKKRNRSLNQSTIQDSFAKRQKHS